MPSSSIPSVSTAPPQPLLTHPPFIAYLNYLLYFRHPSYTSYLLYPGPTLKNLELLQNERFRKEVLSPEVVGRLGEEGVRAAVEFFSSG
jgi:mediator of RNA polymerase II transcription subunit 31